MDALKIIWTLWLLSGALMYLRAEWFMVCPPNPPSVSARIRRRWFVAKFDKWMGLYEHEGTETQGYLDKTAYWLPLPCVGVKFSRENNLGSYGCT
jgi:hypothetical protein